MCHVLSLLLMAAGLTAADSLWSFWHSIKALAVLSQIELLCG
jgi:hypothetical protein